jgi:hypothetical protein
MDGIAVLITKYAFANIWNSKGFPTVCTNICWLYTQQMSVYKKNMTDTKLHNQDLLPPDKAEEGLPQLHEWFHRSKFCCPL